MKLWCRRGAKNLADASSIRVFLTHPRREWVTHAWLLDGPVKQRYLSRLFSMPIASRCLSMRICLRFSIFSMTFFSV